MTYAVKEIYYTLQGEGAQAGRAAVFLRFAGCNLWTGREKDRENAVCRFCDTQFVGTDGENGGKFNAPDELAEKVSEIWGSGRGKKLVVCTGGEPLLQLDRSLISSLHWYGFEVAVETNGTIAVPLEVDWVCVSPKSTAELVQTFGNELKLVYPQEENKPEDFERLKFQHFFLSPKDEHHLPDSLKDWSEEKSTVERAVEYCLAHPQWKLSLQTHKILNLK